MAQATGRPTDPGLWQMLRSRPVTGRFVLYRKALQGRQQLNGRGQRARAKRSDACAQREREPWLLCASVSLAKKSARELVDLYRKRMRIEQSFRTLKPHRFGFSFEDTQSQTVERLQRLLRVQALALYVLWIAGTLAERQVLRPRYESNARHTPPTISVITLGWLVLADQALRLTRDDFGRWPPEAAHPLAAGDAGAG
ncbi:MAG: transposase [Pseudomonadota bacterium]